MSKKDLVLEVLGEIDDPELMIDIVSLGLIYDVKIKGSDVFVEMTFTFPGCPFGPSLIEDVKDKILSTNEFRNVDVKITFEPPWTPDKIDPDIRAALNL